jgi:hypothetical protein
MSGVGCYSRRRQNDAHLHHVAASALRAQIFLNVRHVCPVNSRETNPVYHFCQGLIGAVPIGIIT